MINGKIHKIFGCVTNFITDKIFSKFEISNCFCKKTFPNLVLYHHIIGKNSKVEKYTCEAHLSEIVACDRKVADLRFAARSKPIMHAKGTMHGRCNFF